MKKIINLNKLIMCLIFVMLIFCSKMIGFSYAADLAGGTMEGELTLTSDTNLAAAISVSSGKNLVVDLNGYVLKVSTGTRVFVVGSGATLTIKDSNPNSSHYGTVTDNLWVYDSSATSGVEIKGGIITAGTSSDRGGAIFCSGQLTMEGGTIAGCKATPNSNTNENDMTNYPVNTFTNGTGGAVFVNETGSFIMNGGAIKYCKAVIGNSVEVSKAGAVFIDSNDGTSATFTMNGGIISDCTAMNGGAVFVHSNLYDSNTITTGAIFNMSGGEISNCYASGVGSADQNYGGGAVFVSSTQKTDTSVESVATFNMTGGSLINNTCDGMGGAVHTLGNFIMAEGTVLKGNCTTDLGVLVDGVSTYRGYGGAVFSNTETGQFIMNGGSISDSKAASGGGVMVYTSSVFTMNSGTISNCSSQGSGGLGNGGAVYVQASTFNFNNGNLQNCWARRYGGAININQTAKLYLNGECNILNNTANHGGGISQEAGDCQVKLDNENILIKGNIATGNGGGIFIEKGTLDISACTIEENTAGNNGGGIELRVERIGGDITVNMSGGIIRNNSATVNGGGIDIFADYTFSENDTSEDENGKNDVVVNFNTGILNGNTATGNGGGIHIYVNEDNGTAVMNVLDAGNSCGTVIKANSATNNGGGICINGGSIDIKAGIINNCTATNGGAIYVSGGNVNITGGSITNSKATSGGGVYISNGNITMNGGSISNNQAQEYGGGIYGASDTTDLTLTIESGSIIGNIASKNGGGVGVNMGTGFEGIITVGLETCKGLDETHSHPIIKDNTANEYGGGFWLNGDSMTMNMYCGSIKENLAILESGSSNIYQTGGNAIVHAGEVGEGVIVIGGEYIYVPDNDIPEVKIIYNSNNPDNEEETIAYVTVGVEIYLPKNLFTREGYVLYGWSYSTNPTLEEEIMIAGTPYKVDEEATIYAVWKIEGQGKVQTPVIKSGKYYEAITGGTNIMLSQDASFTVQMSVLEMQPNYYTNRTLSFDKNLVNGTTITMVDLSNLAEIEYFYYKVENDTTKTIPLTEFIKNGYEENYANSTSSDTLDETFLFIVELPKNNEMTGIMQVTLKREATDTSIASIEQSVTYTATAKRNFDFSYENGHSNFELNFSYENTTSAGDDTRYNDKYISLIITTSDEGKITEEAKIWDGTNYYTQNGNGQFIIPLGNINTNIDTSIQLISKTLNENEIQVDLKSELWASESLNDPCMGEKVAEIENIALNSIELPAIIVSMDKKAYTVDEFTGDLELKYKAANLDDYNVTLEIQKKTSNDLYETQTGILTTAEGNSGNTDGVFDIDLNTSGNIDLEFVEDLKNQCGTYRILMKALDSTGNVILEVPYNFLILE